MDKSFTSFRGNIALNSGATFFVEENCCIKLMQNSEVLYIFNIAEIFGGGLILYYKSHITVEGNSLALFERNQALFGGAIYLKRKCDFIIDGNPVVVFKSNHATGGGAVYAMENSDIMLKGESSVMITKNSAKIGGALFQKTNLAFILRITLW